MIGGITELISSFVKAAVLAEDRSTEAVKDAARKVQADARSRVPVVTGTLRDSIEVTSRGLTAEVGPTADYAPFVEFGTWKDSPQPFMQPAADIGEKAFVKAMEDVAGKLL